MGSALYFDREINLSPLEQRYIATCDCVDEYPHSNQTMAWKAKLASSSMRNDAIMMRSSDIILPFPTLAYLVCTESLGIDWPVVEYFEGVDAKSHNARLSDMAKRYPINRVIRHSRDCSVELQESSGDLSDPFELSPSTGYVFTHGRNTEGRIIIREAREEDVKKWFGDKYRGI